MRIGHYMQDIWVPGGVASYIRRISQTQIADGHEVFYFNRPVNAACDPADPAGARLTRDDADLFLQAAALKLDILHLHSTVAPPPETFTLPMVRTLHTHSPYCPSGGRFLLHPGKPCDRAYSITGCLYGHAVNRCGSVRPAAILQNFRTTRTEMRVLSRRIPVITVSEFCRQQMLRENYDPEHIHVLHLPVPPVADPSTPPVDGVPRFVFLGRITPHKGLGWLIQTLRHVRKPFHLDVAGEGNVEAELRQTAAALGLADRITFHGWVDSQRVNALLQSARALIFPSIWHEPGGTVAFEAMVNSRAVVMSRVGGMPEVVHDGENGLLVDPGDELALARAIELLINDHGLAARMGSVGRNLALNNYSLRAHVDRLHAIYAHYEETRVSHSTSQQVFSAPHSPAINSSHDMPPPSATPVVSIGMPVYNGEGPLREALDSILAQTFTDFELIISDNASTDSTAAICREYAAHDRRIHFHQNEENIGAARNYNRVFDLATGQFFKWMAHDDVIGPTYLSQCVDALRSTPSSVVAVFPKRRLMSLDGKILPPDASPFGHSIEIESCDNISYWRILSLPGWYFPNFAFSLIRANELRKIRPLGGFCAADTVQAAEIRLLGEMREVPEELYFQRLHDGDPAWQARLTRRGEAVWFDPSNKDRVLLPGLTLFKQHVGGVWHAKINPALKAWRLLQVSWFGLGKLARLLFAGAIFRRVATELKWSVEKLPPAPDDAPSSDSNTHDVTAPPIS